MGCASGFAYFAHRFRIIGLGLSFTSLAQVAPLYETCLQADAVRAIPLPDASVDAVLSSFVWEHILPGVIDREGHLGWQTPAENRAAFESAGFQVVEQRGHEKTLISPFMYDKVRHWGGGLRALIAVGDRLRKKPWSQLYNDLVRAFDETVGRALHESWSRVLVSVCQKQ